MSQEIQHETYDDAERIKSEPTGLLSRDNRNHHKKQAIILEAVSAEQGDRVLEVGCGHGLHARRYADRFEYVGVDLSASLVDVCRTAASEWPVDATFKQMDAMTLDWPAEEFDAVVGTAILHHLGDPQGALEEWARVVKPGGTVVVMEPNPMFPKDLVETYTRPEEYNKRYIFPWRLRRTLADLEGVSWRVEPRIYTLPWPRRLHGVYDRVDGMVRRVPGVRWAGQMLLIELQVE